MVSLWGKEFLIFINLLKYAVILGGATWVFVVCLRALYRVMREEAPKEHLSGNDQPKKG